MSEVFALTTHPLPPVSRSLLRLTMIVMAWEMRRRTRKDLGALTRHMLLDIGLDPVTAMTEAAKPFWKP